MGCCSSRDTFVNPYLKYILFFSNFMFWLAGLFLLAIGLWAHLEKDKFSFEDTKSVFDFITDLSILCVITGCIIFMLAFCGCLGALRENSCLIRLYVLFLILIFVGQVSGATYIFVMSKRFKDAFVKLLQDELVPLYTENEEKRMLVDWIQEELGCCGMSADGYKDWNNNPYFNCTKENQSPLSCAVPHSCCVKQDTVYDGVPNILCGSNSLKLTSPKHNIYHTGCVSSVMRLAEDNLVVVVGIILGFALPQIFGIVLGKQLDGQITDQLARWRRMNERHPALITNRV